MAQNQPGPDVHDEYGIDGRTAEDILGRYLHETLGESDARLQDLRLEDGRWQARVTGSRRGVGTVFLQQHTGTVVGGHTSAESPLIHEEMEASHRHGIYPEAEGPEQDVNQSIPYNAAALAAEAEEEAGQMHYQTLKWSHPTGHKSAPAGRGRPGGTRGVERGGRA